MAKIKAGNLEFNTQEELDKYMADQAAEIEKMQAALANPTVEVVVADDDIVVTVDKDKYKFLVKEFTLPGEVVTTITAEEAAKDKDLIKSLVDKKSGILIKLDPKTK
jgi:putative heme iron utilization protein